MMFVSLLKMIMICVLYGWEVASHASEAVHIDLAIMSGQAASVEKQWESGEVTAYFSAINALLQKINVEDKTVNAVLRYKEFLRIGEAALNKSIANQNNLTGVERKSFYTAQIKIASLLSHSNIQQLKEGVDYAAIRNAYAQSMISYVTKVAHVVQAIPADKRWELTVCPPMPSSDIMICGMDPRGIKDPVARQTYEMAIEENGKRQQAFNERFYLEQRIRFLIQDIDNYLRVQYSNPPVQKNELETHLQNLNKNIPASTGIGS
jgi:hypothetical protein